MIPRDPRALAKDGWTLIHRKNLGLDASEFGLSTVISISTLLDGLEFLPEGRFLNDEASRDDAVDILQ